MIRRVWRKSKEIKRSPFRISSSGRGTIDALRARRHPPSPTLEAVIRTLLVSLLGAAALAAGLVLIRQTDPQPLPRSRRDSHAGESEPGTISLERLRALGY
jgi:hypothetical protein